MSYMHLRLKAFLVHLLFSAVLAGLVMFVVLEVWYQPPLHTALGVTHIFLLLVVVDVTIGPLLTFLVFDPKKKSLFLDLSIIFILQLCALCYGVVTMAEGRPAWIVLNADRFDLVRVMDIDERRLEQASDDYRKPSWFGPQWVFARPPVNNDYRDEILLESMLGGNDISQRPDLYMPLSNGIRDGLAQAKSIEELRHFNSVADVKSVLAQWPEADVWLPMRTNRAPMVVLMNKKSSEILGVVDLRPWN